MALSENITLSRAMELNFLCIAKYMVNRVAKNLDKKVPFDVLMHIQARLFSLELRPSGKNIDLEHFEH